MKIKDYFTPKSFVYSGKHQDVKTVIRHFYYNEKEIIESDQFEIKKGFKSYIQVIGLSNIKKIEEIKSIINIDSILLEDIFNVSQREKIEVREDYLFSVLHGLVKKEENIHPVYMSVLCKEDVLVSFHETEPWFLDATIDTLYKYQDLRERSTDFLYHHIMDLMTDHHMAVFEDLNHRLFDFEEITLDQKILPQEDFYQARKLFIQLKTNIFDLLEDLERIIKTKHPFIKPEHTEYYGDLIDHLKRIDRQVNLARENLRNLVDVNINNQSNRMNQIMTTLTLFSAIFIPLSFLTGFFGMNFIYFEILEYRYAITIFTLICLLVIILMIVFFKKKKWL